MKPIVISLPLVLALAAIATGACTTEQDLGANRDSGSMLDDVLRANLNANRDYNARCPSRKKDRACVDYRSAILSNDTQCLLRATCEDAGEYFCLNRAYDDYDIAPEPGTLRFRETCNKRFTECNPYMTTRENMCGKNGFLRDDILTLVDACLAKPCAEITACLNLLKSSGKCVNY
jgi:hypothetical protein